MTPCHRRWFRAPGRSSARLRELVLVENAIVGIDLADKKQMVVGTDHDSRVLSRKTFGLAGRLDMPMSG